MGLACYVFDHDWTYSPAGNRRACKRCLRREYRSSYGFRGHRMERYEDWDEHTYPLDADPAHDPSPIYVDGYCYTLGAMAVIDEIFKEVL